MKKIITWFKGIWNNQCIKCGSNLIDWYGASICPKCSFNGAEPKNLDDYSKFLQGLITPNINFELRNCSTLQLFSIKRQWEEIAPNSEQLKVVITELKRRYKQA